MNNIALEYSQYPGDVKISKIHVDRDIVDIKHTLLSEDVPTFLSFVNPTSYENNSVFFNKLSNITPFFFLENSDINIYKYQATTKLTYDKKTFIKQNTSTIVTRTSEIPHLINVTSSKKYVYTGVFYPTNINNIVFNNIDTSIINGDIISLSAYADNLIDSETYLFPDFGNNLIRIYVFSDVESESLTSSIEFTVFNLITQFESNYFLFNKVVEYSLETYTVETTCFSKEKKLTEWEFYTFQPVEEYSSYRRINTNGVDFTYPFNNNYFCIPKNISYVQYNLYDKKYSVYLLDTDTLGAPIYIYPQFNEPKFRTELKRTDSIYFIFTRVGHSSIPLKIPFTIVNSYAIDIITNETLYMEYDNASELLLFNQSFSNRTYKIFVEYAMPDSVGEKLSIDVEKTKIYDISFYSTNILEKADIQVSYDGSAYNAYIGFSNNATNQVSTITASINQSIQPIVTDLRKVNLFESTGRIGNTPYELSLSPYKNTKYIMYTPALEEYYKRVNFDINYNPKYPMEYMEKNIPFYTSIMWLNIVELNKPIECELTIKIENNYVIIMINIKTETNLHYYIKNVNPAMSDAFLKTLDYYGSSVIDQFDQNLFTDDTMITKRKRVSFAMTPVKVPYNMPNFKLVQMEVGLYDSVFNYFGKPVLKELEIDITGFGRNPYGEGLYGDIR